ncbi:MAG: helix-turn-helix domain-containing protein, partial [Ghiorsea sp.]|nr:helix-turn-helix domain-containing protein [Ghiorsea sp.]
LLSDVTLTEMAQLGKIDGIESPFERVSGMGIHKIEAYGDIFAEVIKSHAGKKSAKKSANDKPVLLAKGPSATDTQTYTWNLYKAGKSLDEIAAEQGMNQKTILNHFIALVRAAHYIEVRKIIGEDRFKQAMEELNDADPYASLSEVKGDLEVELTNEEFRLMLAWREGIGVS